MLVRGSFLIHTYAVRSSQTTLLSFHLSTRHFPGIVVFGKLQVLPLWSFAMDMMPVHCFELRSLAFTLWFFFTF